MNPVLTNRHVTESESESECVLKPPSDGYSGHRGRRMSVLLRWSTTTMDFKPSVSVLFGHYSLPW